MGPRLRRDRLRNFSGMSRLAKAKDRFQSGAWPSWAQATWTARRVFRGGSWNNNPRNLRAASRNNNNPENRNNDGRFRVASTIFARISRVTALESVHFSSRAGHDDHGRGKWFAPDTAAAPVLAFGRQGLRSPSPLGERAGVRGSSYASHSPQVPPSLCLSPRGERGRLHHREAPMHNQSRQNGPAIEAHFRFLLWLGPTVENFPRDQNFTSATACKTRCSTCWKR